MASNKKELLEGINESEFQGLDESGEIVVFSVFNLDNKRAENIARDVTENILEWLKGQKDSDPGLGYSPQTFMKVAARNLELNGEAEVNHFIYTCGSIQAQMQAHQRQIKMRKKFFEELEKSGVIDELKNEFKRFMDGENGPEGPDFSNN